MGSNNKKIELGYWKYRGLGHSLRYILQYLGVDYEEKNYYLPEGGVPPGQWLKIREKIRTTYPPKLDFPNVPYLIDDGKHISESRAVMRYIARTYGPDLLGKTPDVQTKAEMLENFLYDFWYMDFAAMIYEHTKESIDNFEFQKKLKLPQISKFVGNNKWSTGDELTYMDFWLCEFLQHVTAHDAKILEPYPNLITLRDNFFKLPAIVKYIKSPDFIKAPYYSPRATYQL